MDETVQDQAAESGSETTLRGELEALGDKIEENVKAAGGTTTPGTTVEPKPAEEPTSERGPTEYVVLRLRELYESDEEGGKPIDCWEKLAVVTGATRAAAYAEAKVRVPVIVPTENGQREVVQLVPMRFWRTITAGVVVREPELEVDGL
jgi:hypothetical protein